MTAAPTPRRSPLWSVRTQIMLLGTGIALLVGLIVASDAWVLRSARDRFEQEDVRSTENRARAGLQRSFADDRRRITETAWWDELYQWVERPHGKLPDTFLHSNFVDWLPVQYGDRYIGIWRADGTPLFEWSDPRFPSLIGQFPTTAISALLDRQRVAAGLLAAGGSLLAVTGAVILPASADDSSAPARGYLVTLRPAGDSFAGRLGESLQQHLDLRSAIAAPRTTIRLVYAGGDSAATAFGVTDLFGRRNVVMEVRASREFLSTSERWMWRSNLIALGMGIAFLTTLGIFAFRFLLRPFTRIGTQLAQMRSEGRIYRLQGTPTAREWAEFTDTFNRLADARERAERELGSARDEALASTRAKSDFLANMSHEIRTPMNAILGLSDLLRRTPLAPEQLRYVNAVHGSGEALLTLVNDILDLSKVEAGKLVIETVPFDLHRAVGETVAIFAHRAAERGVELSTVLAPDLPCQVLGDPGRVRQVLTNLVGNALKFTREGRVLVRLSPDGPPEDGMVHCEVIDSGIGIPPEKLERIFEKFAQADASTTRKFGGTGLGLSISRQLVELMGGTLAVTSAVDQGSTFSFTVPLPVCTGVPARLPRDLPLTGLRVLQVSADGPGDPAHTASLISAGLEVTESPAYLRPEEALLQAAEGGTPFHFVVVEGEQMSPAVQHAIAASRRELWPSVAVMAVIRRGFRGAATHARVAGAHGCLVQPVPVEDLREALSVARQVVQGGLSWPLITRQWLLEARAADEDHALTASATTTRQGLRVLVTDDNELNRLVAGEYLRRLGCVVETADGGPAAIERLNEGGIDLVFMDCQMPELDGYQTTQRIRALPGNAARVPVVAMTASAMQGDRERCLAAGMDDYISKPVREGDLSRMLRRWCAAEPGTQTMVTSPSGEGAGEVPPIDAGALSGLASSGPGAARLAGRLTDLYLRETPTHLRELDAALRAGDKVTAGRLAHTLRGASGVMGAHVVVQMCERIERALEEGSTDAALDAFVLLGTEAERALAALGLITREAPALDEGKLEEYRRMEELSPGLTTAMFELFLRDVPVRLTAIEAAIAAEDAGALLNAAHALKGGALQLGAMPLGRLGAALESDGHAGAIAAARDRLPHLVREWDRAREAAVRLLQAAAAQRASGAGAGGSIGAAASRA